MKRVVVKIGSSNIIKNEKLDFEKLEQIAEQAETLRKKNIEVVIVSSGAVAMGKEKFGNFTKEINLRQKQALAAIGQPYLMRKFREAFSKRNLDIAQVLLTKEDLNNRKRYINARETIWEILNYGIVPIINENDTISTDEIKIGDNDNLSAMVASAIDANLLLILSDVDGLYTENPKNNPNAELISEVKAITTEIEKMAGDKGSNIGTGGMVTKIEAARYATNFGIKVYIINGDNPSNISNAVLKNKIGTKFLPVVTQKGKRKIWIGYGARSKGKIYIDKGAEQALKNGKSLLPSGVYKIEGKFHIGDGVKIFNETGKEVAKGLTNYDFNEAMQIMRRKSGEITDILGYKYQDEIVHRNNMVVLEFK